MTGQRPVILALLLLVLVGCSSMLSWEPDRYTVKTGDTLYAIAWRYDLDPRDLADWNNLGSGNLIYPGQSIRLTAPDGWQRHSAADPRPTGTSGISGPSATSMSPRPVVPPPSAWRWPTEGILAARFGHSALGGNGIDISGRSGQPVIAAAGGEVVYSGSGLIGYGKLIIVKHNETYLSAYGHNRELRVTEGEKVSAGQMIALMGEGPGRKPVLHFEIRQNGKPVDPLRYLPRR